MRYAKQISHSNIPFGIIARTPCRNRTFPNEMHHQGRLFRFWWCTKLGNVWRLHRHEFLFYPMICKKHQGSHVEIAHFHINFLCMNYVLVMGWYTRPTSTGYITEYSFNNRSKFAEALSVELYSSLLGRYKKKPAWMNCFEYTLICTTRTHVDPCFI